MFGAIVLLLPGYEPVARARGGDAIAVLAATSSVIPAPEMVPDWAKIRHPVPRKALVVGLGSYDHATQLATPVHDAEIVSNALTSLSFTIEPQFLVKGRMERTALLTTIKHFAATLNEGDVAFVYFSGHGLDAGGDNYLVPSDGVPNPDNPVRAYVPLSFLLEQLDKRRVAAAVILLDACRANPFTGTEAESRDVLDVPAAQPAVGTVMATVAMTPAAAPASSRAEPSVGLASVDTGPEALLLEYAAQPQHAAFSLFKGDQPAAGSIFTRKVVLRLEQMKDQPIQTILGMAEIDVFKATYSQQKPFQNPFGFGYLLLAPSPQFLEMEEESWARSVAPAPAAQEIQALNDFLRIYPNSDHSFAARQRIAELTPTPPAAELALFDVRGTSSPTISVVGNLQTVGRHADGTAVAAANGDVALRGDWGKRFTEDRLATIRSGELVRVVDVQPGSTAVKVITQDGLVGYVGHLGVVNRSEVTDRATLSFPDSDPFAEAVDWKPLTSLPQRLTDNYVAVTIKTAWDPDAQAPAEAAQLRALRLRDAVIARGVPRNKISIEPADPKLAPHTAEILVSKAAPQ